MKCGAALALFSVLSFYAGFAGAGNRSFYDPPLLQLRPYESLNFPAPLDKPTLVAYLQKAIDELYEIGFTDVGDLSDFMHMHVLFQPINPSRPAPPTDFFSKPDYEFDWTQVRLHSFVIHTREYEGARARRPHPANLYLTREGRPLDEYMRNFIMWADLHRPLERAHLYRKPGLAKKRSDSPEGIPYTVSPYDLQPTIFGEKVSAYEFSVYFFRISCEADELSSQNWAQGSAFEVNVGGERVCLNFATHYCRNHSEESSCRGSKELSSYY